MHWFLQLIVWLAAWVVCFGIPLLQLGKSEGYAKMQNFPLDNRSFNDQVWIESFLFIECTVRTYYVYYISLYRSISFLFNPCFPLVDVTSTSLKPSFSRWVMFLGSTRCCNWKQPWVQQFSVRKPIGASEVFEMNTYIYIYIIYIYI